MTQHDFIDVTYVNCRKNVCKSLIFMPVCCRLPVGYENEMKINGLCIGQETTQHDLAGYIKGDGNLKLALIRNRLADYHSFFLIAIKIST